MPVSCLLVQDTSLGQGGIAKAGGSLISRQVFSIQDKP